MTSKFFKFHSALMGFNCYLDGELMPKYILFWKGYDSHRILTGNSRVKLKER